mmetsp:Transcript_6833/g.27969  ORF Transcript_6833/g.27969 Transcript_6833/m.27969 type:complete len:495 (-) Transcript_6833:154-1638(-)
MDGPGAAVAALRANIERWDRGPLKVSIKPLPATSGGAVVPIVMRWSQPTPHQPVPEHYATITAAMRRQPDGKAWSAQYRLEHESYVYSDAEMARLCRKLVLRTVQAMARAAAAAAALDVIEPFEETRLSPAPGSAHGSAGCHSSAPWGGGGGAGPGAAAGGPAGPAAGPAAGAAVAGGQQASSASARATSASPSTTSEEERCATRIQAAARGRSERLRVARLRAELAAKTEQDASAVRMTGYLARSESGSADPTASGEWSDEQARAALHIQAAARGRLARRRVQGLQSGGERIAVRAAGDEAAAEQARAGDVELQHADEARRAAELRARQQEEAERERAAVKIQAIARGRAARRGDAAARARPLSGRAAVLAGMDADASGEDRARRAADGLVTRAAAAAATAAGGKASGEAGRGATPSAEEVSAATKIQALTRGRATRRGGVPSGGPAAGAARQGRAAESDASDAERQSAVRIQAAARGRLARRRVAQMGGATA